MVRTSMNRCIHCTRCVRFTAEVAGTGDMGSIGRGEDMEITTYLETAMHSELQGNIADLCPVGALAAQALCAFKARSVGTDQDALDRRDGRGWVRISASIRAGAKSCASCRASTMP